MFKKFHEHLLLHKATHYQHEGLSGQCMASQQVFESFERWLSVCAVTIIYRKLNIIVGTRTEK